MTEILPVKGGHLDWVFPTQLIKLTVKWDQLMYDCAKKMNIKEKWVLCIFKCEINKNVFDETINKVVFILLICYMQMHIDVVWTPFIFL